MPHIVPQALPPAACHTYTGAQRVQHLAPVTFESAMFDPARRALLGPPKLPKHVPTPETRREIQNYVAIGLTQSMVAQSMGIDELTLRRLYPNELRAGVMKNQERNVAVVNALYEIASDTTHKQCVTAAIWITKAQMGWQDVRKIDVSGEITHNTHHTFDARALTPEQRESLREMLIQAGGDVEDGEFEEVTEDSDEYQWPEEC